MIDAAAADLVAAVYEVAESEGDMVHRAAAIAGLVQHQTGFRWVGIYSIGNGEVRNLAWRGPNSPAHPVFRVDQGVTGAAIAARAAVVSNDVGKDPRYLMNQETTGSELIVPLLVEDIVVGTVDVEEEQPGAFASEDVALFERIAAATAPLFR